jgi:hypothetical protein
MQNTILARNTVISGGGAVARDCAGSVGSLGNNLVGTYAGCALILFPSDKLGDPGLGFLTDEGPAASGAAFGSATSRSSPAARRSTPASRPPARPTISWDSRAPTET